MPYAVGHVNAYLLKGDPCTLVDPGPRSTVTRYALDSALAQEGLLLSDIELVMLTHHHDDHVGLASTVRTEASCPIAAHELVGALLRDEPTERAREARYAAALLALHGAPAHIVATPAEQAAYGAAFIESVTVDLPLHDGSTITAGGREHRVTLHPGHSPTDTLFVDAQGNAISGDHLLGQSSSPLVAHHPPGAEGDPRTRERLLPAYRESLARTGEMGLSVAFPGHGRPIAEPSTVIAARLSEQDARAQQIRACLSDQAVTAWELVEMLWPKGRLASTDHPVSFPYVLICHVLAHLDLLLEYGEVCEHSSDDGPIRYTAPHRKSRGA